MARRRGGSPLSNIIRWFLGAGLAEAEQALETAQAIVEQKREQSGQLARPARAARVRQPFVAPPQPTAEEIAAAPKPRQRARRSDAGKPRNTAAAMAVPPSQTAVAPLGAVRRRRAPAVAQPAAVAEVPAAGPLPDSAVPVGEES